MLCQYVADRTNTDHCGAPPGKRIDGSGERPVALPPWCEVPPCRCRTSQTGGCRRTSVLPKNYLTHSLENAYKTWQRTIYCKQSSWRVVAEQRRPILIRPNRFWAVSFDGYRTDASLQAIYNPKIPRGGVNSERRVNPCGNRPRPTGRDLLFGHQDAGRVGQQIVGGIAASRFRSAEQSFHHRSDGARDGAV